MAVMCSCQNTELEPQQNSSTGNMKDRGVSWKISQGSNMGYSKEKFLCFVQQINNMKQEEEDGKEEKYELKKCLRLKET